MKADVPDGVPHLECHLGLLQPGKPVIETAVICAANARSGEIKCFGTHTFLNKVVDISMYIHKLYSTKRITSNTTFKCIFEEILFYQIQFYT